MCVFERGLRSPSAGCGNSCPSGSTRSHGAPGPWGELATLVVNALGAFGLAFVASRGLPESAPWVYQGITVGFLGSYTTSRPLLPSSQPLSGEWLVSATTSSSPSSSVSDEGFWRDVGSVALLGRRQRHDALTLLATVTLGALGALLRWWIGQQLPSAPWWSLGIVNVTGSAGIGVVAALPETVWTYPLMVGLAGALTTFSALARHDPQHNREAHHQVHHASHCSRGAGNSRLCCRICRCSGSPLSPEATKLCVINSVQSLALSRTFLGVVLSSKEAKG